MKRIIQNIGWGVISAIFLISCGKSDLELDPNGEVLETDYYQTGEQVYEALMGAYNPVIKRNLGSWDDAILVSEEATDNVWAGGGSHSDNAVGQHWSDYDMTSELGPSNLIWNRNYSGIYRVNNLLDKLENKEEDIENFDTDEEARYKAELKFLRGYYYYWLVINFKNVVLMTEPVPQDEIYDQIQADPEEVYEQIEKDFRAAIEDLPQAPLDEQNAGRATKEAAKAFLAKTIMFRSGTDNERMDEVVDLLEDINSKSVFELVDDYGELFQPEVRHTTEAIFEHVYTEEAKGNSPGDAYGFTYAKAVSPRNSDSDIYGDGWGYQPITENLEDEMKDDPRYQHTILNMEEEGIESYEESYDGKGFYNKKWAMLKEFESSSDPEFNYPQDYIEVRLADTYLLEAEALLRGGGDADKAKTYLNAVRERVGLDPIDNPDLDDIYHERRIELALEGHRLYDLIRTDRAADKLSFKGFQEGVNEVLPIPQSALDNTELEQNPGY